MSRKTNGLSNFPLAEPKLWKWFFVLWVKWRSLGNFSWDLFIKSISLLFIYLFIYLCHRQQFRLAKMWTNNFHSYHGTQTFSKEKMMTRRWLIDWLRELSIGYFSIRNGNVILYLNVSNTDDTTTNLKKNYHCLIGLDCGWLVIALNMVPSLVWFHVFVSTRMW